MVDYSPEIFAADERELIERMLEAQRQEIVALLDDVTEDEARARLVPSLTTLLGLVKHAAFVERVWFGHRIGGRSRAEVGIPDQIDDSFRLAETDSIASVRAAFLAACDESRQISREHTDFAETFPWRYGPVSIGFIHVHLIQEYARHCGHGDILREQLQQSRK